MVSAVSNNGTQLLPAAATAAKPSADGTTPVFSVSSLAPAAKLASAAPASAGTPASPASASQVSDGENDFRQLFGGVVAPAIPFTTKAAADALNFGNPAPATPASSPAASSGATASPASAGAADPTLIPVFQGATVTDGTNVWNLNSGYFADQPTAQWLADKYGTGVVVQTPFFNGGGPYSASASQNEIVLSNGATVNAGVLASYYARNPESEFPGLADTLIRNQLAQDYSV
jgi:hypothetical protein